MVRARLEKLTQHILERPLFHVLDAALEGMLGRLQMGDRLLVSELSRLGRSLGQVIGRPKGALGKSRLDGKEQDIRVLLGKNVSKASIAKILDVSRSALYHFIETRKIVPS